MKPHKNKNQNKRVDSVAAVLFARLPAPRGDTDSPYRLLPENALPAGLSLKFLLEHGLVPLEEMATSSAAALFFAAAEPLPLPLIDTLANEYALPTTILLCPREIFVELSEATQAIDPHTLGGDAEREDFNEDILSLKLIAEDAPVIRYAQELLVKAIDARASDIHIEKFRNNFRIRQRIDGMLIEKEAPSRSLYLPLVSHLKLRAQMDIAERRLPQDGRIRVSHNGRDIDFRVSTAPTIHGESMVLRVLDQSPGLIDIDDLGMSGANKQLLAGTIELPHGLILVTGPTGSGKTTTLYAAIKLLNRTTRKIITVEDPVEYQIGGINQIQVKPQIDLTFANTLRTIVRQDPDVLLIGEIRDRETADIAIQSALTGHLVLSSLHTNDVAGAPHRLLDMGIEPYLLSSSISLVIAQRLIRTLCQHCKAPHPATESDRLFLKNHHLDLNLDNLFSAKGCPHCAGTGYRGRTGIFEFLEVSEKVKEAILRKESASRLRKHLNDANVPSLYVDGLRLVGNGTTTLEELARVARLDTFTG